MPVSKQLAPNGTTAFKRRSRLDLTRAMISAPLGDFRHTMHVGRGGEAFGDTSFLSNHGPSKEREGNSGPIPQEEDEEDEGEEEAARPPPEAATELLGDCGGGRRLAGEGSRPPPSPPPPPPPPGGMSHAESVLSFHVDLGPSMLSEVLGVMEKESETRVRPRFEGLSFLRKGDKEDEGEGDGEGDKEEEEGDKEGEVTYTFEEEEDDEIHM